MFVDECTGYMWLYLMFNKLDVFGKFVKFYAFITYHFDAKVHFLQTDGLGEFTSTMFTNFLASKGILHQFSCPYTHQQNGLAECKHRHVVDTAITLLHAASIPIQFWFHSVAHAVYLINRMPSVVLGNLSPFQKLLGCVPDITHLRVFGTTIYSYVRHYNHHKLQPRTVQCVFMGYAPVYKGVICYNSVTGKFIISRHMVHDETLFPFKFAKSHASQSSGNLSSPRSTPLIIVTMPFVVAPPPTSSQSSSATLDSPNHDLGSHDTSGILDTHQLQLVLHPLNSSSSDVSSVVFLLAT